MLSFKIPTIPQSWIDAANKHLSKVGVELDSAFVGQHAETISWAITASILLVVISLVFFPSNADRKRAEAIKRLAEEAKRIQDRADEAAKRHQKSPVTFTLEKLKAFDVGLITAECLIENTICDIFRDLVPCRAMRCGAMVHDASRGALS